MMRNDIRLNTGEKQVMAQLQRMNFNVKPKHVRRAWEATRPPSGILKTSEEMDLGAVNYYLDNDVASSRQSAEGTEEVDDNNDEDEDESEEVDSSSSSSSSSLLSSTSSADWLDEATSLSK